MSGFAVDRLSEERKMWRREHPPGFQTRLAKRADNSTDIMRWECLIPGKAGTPWEEGFYPCTLVFSDDYPAKAPIVTFTPAEDGTVIWHPNVFSSGRFVRLYKATHSNKHTHTHFTQMYSRPHAYNIIIVIVIVIRVCLNILNEMWTPGITIKDILCGLQLLLSEPNAQHVTDRTEPSTQYRTDRAAYEKRTREQAKKFLDSSFAS